ncbi:heavy metal translocating P-type ATPase [Mailhella massiliensis]
MNMDCPMEEALIRKRLSSVEGITGLEFNLMQRVLTVRHSLPSTLVIEEALASIDMIPERLGKAGTPASPVVEASIAWKKLAAAAVFAAFSEASELALAWSGGVSPFLEFLPFLFAAAAIILGGLGTYRKGWIAVSNLNLNINALMSVAVTGAVLIGQYPEAAMVMVLFNISEAIEARALNRARNAIGKLLALSPERAMVQQADGSWEERDIRTVSVGSIIRVKPGERVALDGVIRRGHSAVDQAPITGESIPVEKAEGDIVFAGTINTFGSFEFEATAAASDTTLSRIIHAVEDAQGRRAPIQRFVDAFARRYTPAVFLLSLLTAFGLPLCMDWAWKDAVYTALVLLVIGCPCALVISTPVSIVSGMAAAMRSGILVKGGMFLEQGRLLRCLAFDKTGTLTHGRPRLTDREILGAEEGERSALLAAGLAARSDHPVSRALAENAEEQGLALPDVEDFEAVPGLGVRGRVEGRLYHLGSRRMMACLGLDSAELEGRIAALESRGRTVVALAGEEGVLALFAVADTLRENSREAVRELKELGVHTVMLTGDNENVARVIASQAGVDEYFSGLLPEDKLHALEKLAARGGKVGMAGDGINDAPALARADIGFAMARGGTDTAMETADVALMDDDLRKIPRFIRLSRATYAILVQNIVLALGVKALFFALTFSGCATMWMAVFADVGTALLVVANGLRAAKK